MVGCVLPACVFLIELSIAWLVLTGLMNLLPQGQLTYIFE